MRNGENRRVRNPLVRERTDEEAQTRKVPEKNPAYRPTALTVIRN